MIKPKLLFNLWNLSKLISNIKISWICFINNLTIKKIDENAFGISNKKYRGHINFEYCDINADPEILDALLNIYLEIYNQEERFDNWIKNQINGDVERDGIDITIWTYIDDDLYTISWNIHARTTKDIHVEKWGM